MLKIIKNKYYVKRMMSNRLLFCVTFAFISIMCSDPNSPKFNNSHDGLSLQYIPKGPSKFIVTQVTETSRKLEWNDNAKTEAGYILERKLGLNGTFQEIALLPTNTTSFEDTTVIITDTNYFYRVHSISKNGNKGTAESLSVFLPFCSPYELSITPINLTSARIEWKDSNSFTKNFIVQRKERNGVYQEIALLQSDSKYYIDDKLDSIKEYFYKIKAITIFNQSKYSKEFSIGYIPVFSTQIFQQLSYLDGGIMGNRRSRDGSFFLVSSTHSSFSIFDLLKNKVLWEKNGFSIISCAFSWDNKLVAICNSDYTIRIWRVQDSLLLKTISISILVDRMVFNNDASILVASGGGLQSRLYSWDVEAGLIRYTTEVLGGDMFSIDVSQDGKTLACRRNYDAELRNLENGSLVYTFPGFGTSQYLCGGIKYGKNNLLAITAPHKLEIWDVEKQTCKFSIIENFPSSVIGSFTNDGAYFITCTNKNIYCIWRILDGELLQTWESASGEYPEIFPIAGTNIIVSGFSTLYFQNYYHQWDRISW